MLKLRFVKNILGVIVHFVATKRCCLAENYYLCTAFWTIVPAPHVFGGVQI